MKNLARFTIRPHDQPDGPGDFMMGVMMKPPNQSPLLKPGRIYQIEEILDMLVVRDLGDSAIKNNRESINVSWHNDISQIVYHPFTLTAEEVTRFNRDGWPERKRF